uniref:Uncharacterized protein n=1 Tax=Chrysotila carterae TaxID=13221 RepID=A0A7S4F9E8_CHRCT
MMGVGVQLLFPFLKCAALVDLARCPSQPHDGSWLEVILEDGIEIHLQLRDEMGQKLPKGPQNELIIELFLKCVNTNDVQHLPGFVALDSSGFAQAKRPLPPCLINNSLLLGQNCMFQLIAREASTIGLQATLSKTITFVPRSSNQPSTQVKILPGPVCCSSAHLWIPRIYCEGFDDDMLSGRKAIIKTQKLFGLHLYISCANVDNWPPKPGMAFKLRIQACSMLTNSAWEDLPLSAFQPVEIYSLPFSSGGIRVEKGQGWVGKRLRFVLSFPSPSALSPPFELVGEAAVYVCVNSKPGRPTTSLARNVQQPILAGFSEDFWVGSYGSSSSPSVSSEETVDQLQERLLSLLPDDKKEEARRVLSELCFKIQAECLLDNF